MKGKKDDDDEDSESVITVNDIGPIQLLLSEMDPRLVIRLLEYIYTDTVRGRLDPTSYEVKDLLVLADQFFLFNPAAPNCAKATVALNCAALYVFVCFASIAFKQ